MQYVIQWQWINNLPGTERAMLSRYIKVFVLVEARLMPVGCVDVQHLAALLTPHTFTQITSGSELPSREGPKRMQMLL